MPDKGPIVDFSLYDLDSPIETIEDIRKHNPQRYEMEQLTAIVYNSAETMSAVGYKDITEDEFWVRGHMPEFALMPGVVMCEAAAQMACYFGKTLGYVDGLIAFAALDGVRFRGIVRPGDRFVIQIRQKKLRKKLMTAEFECYVGENLVCDGTLKGFAIPSDQLQDAAKAD